MYIINGHNSVFLRLTRVQSWWQSTPIRSNRTTGIEKNKILLKIKHHIYQMVKNGDEFHEDQKSNIRHRFLIGQCWPRYWNWQPQNSPEKLRYIYTFLFYEFSAGKKIREIKLI